MRPSPQVGVPYSTLILNRPPWPHSTPYTPYLAPDSDASTVPATPAELVAASAKRQKDVEKTRVLHRKDANADIQAPVTPPPSKLSRKVQSAEFLQPAKPPHAPAPTATKAKAAPPKQKLEEPKEEPATPQTTQAVADCLQRASTTELEAGQKGKEPKPKGTAVADTTAKPKPQPKKPKAPADEEKSDEKSDEESDESEDSGENSDESEGTRAERAELLKSKRAAHARYMRFSRSLKSNSNALNPVPLGCFGISADKLS